MLTSFAAMQPFTSTVTARPGYLSASGSHSLEPLVNQIARAIVDPETKVSSWQRLQASILLSGDQQARKEAATRSDLRIGALGSGSDYSAFIDLSGGNICF
jgi:N-acetylated-alpha-linked acidic dipeptidase